ncbi:hypothetical protein OG979_27835 [Actinomadura citrea]|uniref:hypothetical protein n=1 Tax=Actinomadura citrea TaxID=46158 RepID=UPI002E288897|nr:hypothetical protein [Actinomadura citrea]
MTRSRETSLHPTRGASPFTDPAQVSGLYADRHRVDRRSNALLNAKTHGLHVGETAADTIGYLTMRPAPAGPGGRRVFELGVCSYGPFGDQVAAGLASRIHRWEQESRSGSDIWIEVHPAGTTPRGEGLLIADKQHACVIVRTTRTGPDRQLP